MPGCDWEIRVRLDFNDKKRRDAFTEKVRKAGQQLVSFGQLLNDQGVKPDIMMMGLDAQDGPFDIPLLNDGDLAAEVKAGVEDEAPADIDPVLLDALK